MGKLKIEIELKDYDDLTTVNCVHCLDQKGRIGTGHVKCTEGHIGATFCSQKCINDHKFDYDGGAGQWIPEMGINYYDLRNE